MRSRKAHWRRSTRRIGLGIVQLALAGALLYAMKFGVLQPLIALGLILLAVSGVVSYFSGCLALCKEKQVTQSGVVALIAIALLSVPVGTLLTPFGFLLTPFILVLAVFVAPIAGCARPAAIRERDLLEGQRLAPRLWFALTSKVRLRRR